MKSIRIDGQAVNGKRTILADVIPLDTPYSITFFPVYSCNFKCNYCIHSLAKDKRGDISEMISMDFELYKKCIDDIAKFPNKIKAIHFAGLGEPLIHKDITKMIKYAAEKKVSDIIDIVTNGSLLNYNLSKELIDAGLSKLRISIQGLNMQTYKEISQVDIDFEQFIDNIRYFYENKENSKVYIKIMDNILNEDDKEKFFKMFENICDEISIEHLCPLVGDIDYGDISKDEDFIYTMQGNVVPNSDICPQPFYSMQIYPDGKCIPCCTIEKPIVVGNCNNESLKEIWNNEKFNSFRKMHIGKNKNNNFVCAKCNQYKYAMFPEEVLDSYAERLLNLFK